MEQTPEHHQSLREMRILLAEDEFLILACIEDVFREAGAEILSAATLQAAMKIATGEPLSAAVLDVRLGRQSTETVADALAAREIPFFFYTGQALPEQISVKYPEAPVLPKPSKLEALVEVMLKVTRR